MRGDIYCAPTSFMMALLYTVLLWSLWLYLKGQRSKVMMIWTGTLGPVTLGNWQKCCTILSSQQLQNVSYILNIIYNLLSINSFIYYNLEHCTSHLSRLYLCVFLHMNPKYLCDTYHIWANTFFSEVSRLLLWSHRVGSGIYTVFGQYGSGALFDKFAEVRQSLFSLSLDAVILWRVWESLTPRLLQGSLGLAKTGVQMFICKMIYVWCGESNWVS